MKTRLVEGQATPELSGILANMPHDRAEIYSVKSTAQMNPDVHIIASACDRYTLSGIDTDSLQASKLGSYFLQQSTLSSRPVYYSKEARSYLFYHQTDKRWVIAAKLGTSHAGLVVQSRAMNPSLIGGHIADAAKDGQGWYAFSGTDGYMPAPQVQLTCAKVPFIDVSFQLAPAATGCTDDMEMSMSAQLAALQNEIETKNQLGEFNLLDLMGKCGMQTVHTVAFRGARMVECAAAVGGGAGVVAGIGSSSSAGAVSSSHCVYTGTHVQVTHATDHVHSEFNCHHKFDLATNTWDCTCHSWTPSS